MEATPRMRRAVKVPKIKVKMAGTITQVSVIDRTPLPVDVALYQEPDYSETQFSVDLRNVSKRLDAMASEALKEHARGKTRKFPV